MRFKGSKKSHLSRIYKPLIIGFFILTLGLLLSLSRVSANTLTTNDLTGNIWNPFLGFSISNGFPSESGQNLYIDKNYDETLKPGRFIRRVHGTIFNPVIGPITFDASPNRYAYLEQYPQSTGDYYLCGLAWNPGIGFIDLAPADNKLTSACDPQASSPHYSKRIQVNIVNGGVSGMMWNPVVGYIGLGPDGGGNILGFDLTIPIITVPNGFNQNLDSFKFISRRGNKENILPIQTTEYIDYTAEIFNTSTGTTVYSFSDTLGDLLSGNATSLVWDGTNTNLNPAISSFVNLTNATYGQMIPSGTAFSWKTLEDYEKTNNRFFNVDSDSETALNFTGANFLSSSQNISNLRFNNGGLTIEAWIYPDKNSGVLMPIISQETSTGLGNYQLYVQAPNNPNENNLGFAFKSGSNKIYCTTPANSLPKDQWSFVSVTHSIATDYDSATKLYINENQYPCTFSGGAANAVPNVSGNLLYIGYTKENGGRFFQGLISDVTIFNRKRTFPDIKQDSKKVFAGTEPGTKAQFVLANSKYALDGEYKWRVFGYDLALNKSNELLSAPFNLDNTPPLITNVLMTYDVEPHFRRDSNGNVIMNGQVTQDFTVKTVNPRTPDSDSYEISRDISNNPKINLEFELDGMIEYESIQVIPYVGAVGPYPNAGVLTYDKANPKKTISNIGLFADSASETVQVQQMTILVKDKAKNESRKFIEVINNQPKIQIGKFANASKSNAPEMEQANNQVSCVKGSTNPPYCDLITNTLVVSNVAKKTDALLMNQVDKTNYASEITDSDTSGPTVYINGLTATSLSSNIFTARRNTSYYFDTLNTFDESGIISYYWEMRKNNVLQKNGFDSTFDFTFDSSSASYTLYLKVTDSKGNQTIINIPANKFLIQTNDTAPPTANAGESVTWPVGIPYFFNADKSTDNIQVAKRGYQWDFDNRDGTDFSNPDFIGKRAIHTFEAPGVYIVTLKVIDTSGNSKTSTIQITAENADNFDDSLWNPVSGPISSDTSIYLEGLALNGSESIVRIDSEKLNTESRGTVEFWFKPEELRTNQGLDEAILSLGSGELTQNSALNILLTQDRKIRLEVIKENSTLIKFITEKTIDLDRWTHLAFTFGELADSTTYQNTLYLNGEKQKLTFANGSPNYPFNFSDLNIKTSLIGGRIRSGQIQDFYHGNFDELKIWSFPIEESDLPLHMSKKHHGNENFLIYYYSFDQIAEIDTTKALTFNGSLTRGVSQDHPKLRIPDQEISLGAFVKLDKTATGINPIITKANPTNQGNYNLEIDASTKKITFSYFSGTANIYCSTADNVITPGISHYIVLNHKFQDNTKTIFYIDGKKTPCTFSGGSGNELPSNGDKLYLGFNPNGTKYFKGTLDNLTIWREMRTLPEILRDEKGNITGFEKNLIAFYRFEEGKNRLVKNEVSQFFGEVTLENPIWTEDIPKGKTKDEKTKLEETISSVKFGTTGSIDADSAVLNVGTADFTAEGHFKLTYSPNPINLISKKAGLSTGAGFLFYQDPSTNSLKAKISNGTTEVILTSNREVSSLFDNKFHHLAISLNRSSQKLKLYIDGKLDQEIPITGFSGTLNNTEKFYLGKGITGLSNFTGVLSEFRFWKIDLPLNELKRNMTRRITPDYGFYDELALYLKLSENGQANKYFDYSRNNLTITASNITFNNPKLKSSVPEITPGQDIWWRDTLESQDFSAFFKQGTAMQITNGYSTFFSNQANPFTIEFWLYLEDISNSPTILSKSNDENFALQVLNNGALLFKTADDQILETSPNKFQTHKWQHVSIVYESGVAEILLDGISLITQEIDGPAFEEDTDLYIGRNFDGSNYIQNGYLTDFKIWNKKRTITEILQFLNTRISKYYEKYSDLNAYYKLNGESNYNLIRDDSFSSTPLVGVFTPLIWSENVPNFKNKFAEINADLGHETTLIFRGQESVSKEVPNQEYLDFDRQPFNFEIWIKPKSDIETEQTILSKLKETDGKLYGYKLGIDTAKKPFLELNDGFKTFKIIGRKIIGDDKWHHLSFSFDPIGATVYLFIDGEIQNKDRTKFFDLGSLKNSGFFELGKDRGSTPLFAEVDTLRISSFPRYTTDFYPLKELTVDSYTLGLFNFDESEDTLTKDSSLFNTVLKLSSSAMWYSNLANDFSAYFNSNANIYLDNDNTYNFDLNASSFTIEFNARVTNSSGTLFHWEDTNDSDRIRINYGNNAVSISVSTRTNDPARSFFPATIETINIPINDGKWHHFAISADRAGISRFFIDGISRKEKNISSTSNRSFAMDNKNMYIGSNNSGGEKIVGEIDNFHISLGISKYTKNFKPTKRIIPNNYSKILLLFSSNALNGNSLKNEALIGGNYTFTANNLTLSKLNSEATLFSVNKINDHSGHYLGVDKKTKKLQGQIWNPFLGYMDFDTINEHYSTNGSMTPPQIKNYNPNNPNKVYELEGYFYSPVAGWTALETNLGKTNLDTRTGIIPKGLLFNPFLGFIDLSKKQIKTLDLEAPLLTLTPLASTFLRSDIKSITISGETSDRFGTGTAAVFYKLNNGGYRLALDDSPDHSFSNFHAIVNGLELGENKITFKSVDKNGNSNELAGEMTIFRGYGITQKFFSPQTISKVTFKGDASKGEKHIPIEIRVLLSNNEYFLNDDTVNPPLKTWEVIHIYGNRSAEEHIFEKEDFLTGANAYSGDTYEADVRYARLLIEDTVGHEAPFLDGLNPFKVYTKIENTLTDPWSVEDKFETYLPGVEFYWDIAADYVPKFRAYRSDKKGEDRTKYTLQSAQTAPSFITNVLQSGSNKKSVKFRFSPGFDRDSENFDLGLNGSIIPAEDSVEIEYHTIVTK